jgi:hypothetical protein
MIELRKFRSSQLRLLNFHQHIFAFAIFTLSYSSFQSWLASEPHKPARSASLRREDRRAAGVSFVTRHKLVQSLLHVYRYKRLEYGQQRLVPFVLAKTGTWSSLLSGLWNTIDLERAINALRQHGIPFPDALLTNVSPIGWEHINLTGDYVWCQTEVSGTAGSDLCASNLNRSFLSAQYRTNRQVNPK